MVLLLQLNGELPDRFPGHERRIYVFSCRRPACRRREGSIRALRGLRTFAVQEKEKTEAKKEAPKKEAVKPVTGLGESVFGAPSFGTSSSANPFAASSASANPFSSKSTSAPSNPFATSSTTQASPQTGSPQTKDLPQTFAAALNLNNSPTPAAGPAAPHEPWPAESVQPQAYPVLWIAEAEYEAYDPSPTKPAAAAESSKWLSKVDQAEGRTEGDEDTAGHDGAFLRFVERVGQNPEQAIRYEFAGRPLLYSKTDAVGRALHQQSAAGPSSSGAGMTRCGNCGAQRVFEVQLMPRAILELEEGEEGMDGMDWGTIIVGTCERDCVPRGAGDTEAGYLEEWVGVQWEQLGKP